MKRQSPQAPAPLHLHAVDADDLPVLSAALSSAAVKRGDLGFEKRGRKFAMVCNRFRWEDDDVDGVGGGSRIRAGISILDVESVQSSGLSGIDGETVLELLSIQSEPRGTPPEATVTINFAGGPAIRLLTGCIDVLVDDMGRAWYTPNRPDHEGDRGDGQ
jgi:hypothetical protein